MNVGDKCQGEKCQLRGETRGRPIHRPLAIMNVHSFQQLPRYLSVEQSGETTIQDTDMTSMF